MQRATGPSRDTHPIAVGSPPGGDRPRRSARRPAARRVAGFSLAELLLAVALGAVLTTSVASALSLFSLELEHVRDEPDTRLEEAAVQVTEKLRDAWWAELPAATDLRLADPAGNLTRVHLVGDELRLVQPSGAEGVLLSGVASLAFGAEPVTRLRDAPPVTVDAPWFTRPSQGGPEFELTLKAGDELALGFQLDDDAPDSVDTVPGVNEERLDAALHEIVITAAFLSADRKEFCHLHANPPHNPTHPGYEGNKLLARLHEARAPGDGRPYGPALGSIEVPVEELPHASFYWWDTEENAIALPPDAAGSSPTGSTCADADEDGECDHPGKSKHKNPVDVPGGVAWGWWKNHPHVVHIVNPVTMEVPIPLDRFGVALERGKAYALVLSVAGWDELRVRGEAALGTTGTAFKASGGSFVSQPQLFPFTLQGDQTCTQTEAIATPASVRLAIEMLDGRSLTTSVGLLSQTSVPDPWLGVVPGQIGAPVP